MYTNTLSRYHLTIVSVYLLFVVWFFLFIPDPLSYFAFVVNDLPLLIGFSAISVSALYLLNLWIKYRTVTQRTLSFKELILTVFYAFVLISLPEEILFRLLIQGSLTDALSHVHTGIVAAALLFGIAHSFNGKQPYKLMLLSAVFGLCLGYAYYLTNSLIVPIFIHGLVLVCVRVFTVSR